VESRVLRLALDIIHGVRTVHDYDIEQLEATARGFDVLGCRIDVSPALWILVRNLDIDGVRARMSRLVRSGVRDLALHDAVQKAPLFEDIVATIRACEPDPEVAIYLGVLARVYPPYKLAKELVAACVPKPTLDQTLRIVSRGEGTFTHPAEFAAICAMLADYYRPSLSRHSSVAAFVASAAGALNNYDVAPQTALFGTSVAYEGGAKRASAFMILDGKCPKRDVQVCKWLRVNFHEFHLTIRPRAVDAKVKHANFLDVRVFVDLARDGEHAEAWYSWTQSELASVVGTSSCPRVLGDVADLVDRGVAGRRCTVRVDVFFSESSSAIDNGLPLFSSLVA
jgi:hypothetical protein